MVGVLCLVAGDNEQRSRTQGLDFWIRFYFSYPQPPELIAGARAVQGADLSAVLTGAPPGRPPRLIGRDAGL